MPVPVRDTSGFARASHQSQALCLGTLGLSGLLWPIAVWGFGSPLRFIWGWAAAGFGVWLLIKAREQWQLHELEEELETNLTGFVQAAENPALLERGQLHPLVERILEVSESNFKNTFKLDTSKVEFEEGELGDRRLISWGLRGSRAGVLSDEKLQKRVRETFSKSLAGFWRINFDTGDDSFTATQIDNLPKLCFPNPKDWAPVSSIDDAKRRYKTLKINLGRGENDSLISTSVWDYPHMQFIGESGAGKSVAVKTILEQLRAAGWMLLIGDGKGVDYNGFNVQNPDDHGLPPPGTIAYGTGIRPRSMDYVGVIVIAYQEMAARQDMEQAASSLGKEISFPPVFVLLDEIKSLRSRWKSALTKEENSDVEAMVEQITALGRQFRIHLAIVSQDAYRDSIPRQWVSNIRLRLVVGRPSLDTVQKSFEGDKLLKSRVDDIRETMNPKDKGRCIITTMHEDTGHIDVSQYQNFYTYCPGEIIGADKHPPEAVEEWTRFKAEVSDRIPRLYSRTWFKIDHKSEAQLELETENQEDLGFIDFDLFTVAEIKKMKRIKLDKRGDGGAIVPDPDNAKYDPSSPLYVCREPLGARSKRYVNLEI